MTSIGSKRVISHLRLTSFLPQPGSSQLIECEVVWKLKPNRSWGSWGHYERCCSFQTNGMPKIYSEFILFYIYLLGKWQQVSIVRWEDQISLHNYACIGILPLTIRAPTGFFQKGHNQWHHITDDCYLCAHATHTDREWSLLLLLLLLLLLVMMVMMVVMMVVVEWKQTQNTTHLKIKTFLCLFSLFRYWGYWSIWKRGTITSY